MEAAEHGLLRFPSLRWLYWFVLLVLWAVMGGRLWSWALSTRRCHQQLSWWCCWIFPQCELCFAGESEGRGRLFCSHLQAFWVNKIVHGMKWFWLMWPVEWERRGVMWLSNSWEFLGWVGSVWWPVMSLRLVEKLPPFVLGAGVRSWTSELAEHCLHKPQNTVVCTGELSTFPAWGSRLQCCSSWPWLSWFQTKGYQLAPHTGSCCSLSVVHVIVFCAISLTFGPWKPSWQPFWYQ